MRDVVDGLEEWATEFAWHGVAGTFEILAVEPPESALPAHHTAEILFLHRRSA